MKPYQITNNQLELYVKPSPKLGRGFIAFLSLIIFVGPILGMFLGFSAGAEFHIGYLLGIGLSSLVAYHFYKLYHWNTCGKEVFTFSENKLNYHADYGKFISNKQEFTFENLQFNIKPVGYKNEKMGVLLIEFDDTKYFESVVVLPIDTLHEIAGNYNRIEITINTFNEN